MSLPSSGQIAFSNVASEMEQTAYTESHYNYWFSIWGRGYNSNYPAASNDFVLAPINVHSSNSGKYTTTTPFTLSNWYGFTQFATYACDGTNRSLFFNISPTAFCNPSATIIFDAGTTSRNLDITISGNSTDFNYVAGIRVWYGRPWTTNGLGYGIGCQLVYENNSVGSGLSTTINYNYTYNAAFGQYIYVVIYGICP